MFISISVLPVNMTDKYIVSACLAGYRCRYDGKDNAVPYVIDLIKQGRAIPVCPEQLGGLPTPREMVEIREDGKAYNKLGEDVTIEFYKGAREGARIGKLYGCNQAILKARSPSCGIGRIYDGNFSKTMIDGNGVFAQYLIDLGFGVQSEEDLE